MENQPHTDVTWMNLGSFLRQGATFFGGILVSRGVIDMNTASTLLTSGEMFIGAAVSIAGVFMSMRRNQSISTAVKANN